MANGIELATAYVSMTVDDSQVAKQSRQAGEKAGEQFTRGADGRLRDSRGRFVKSGGVMGDGAKAGFLGAFGKIAGPLAAVFAGVKVGQFLGDSIAEAVESQKVSAATAAIVKATGGAAKASADDVAALSEALSEKIGVDDEAVQSGANLLLTFKNIRNEAGATNDIFNQSVEAAQDLSAAGFGSIESASKTLGKALNDPVKGMTALGRAGVTFSDAQKEQIKALVESNDLLGAQKIILGEVESQVGGVAEATATTGEKVRVSWDNVKEQIGTALLPMLERLGRWFLEDGLPAIQRFGSWVSDKLWPALKDGWETVRPALEQFQKIISDAFGEDSSGKVTTFASFITDTLIPAVSTFATVYLPVLAQQFAIVINAVQTAVTVMTTIRDRIASVVSTILGAFIGIATGFQSMLETLGNVPGFGWAKTAAEAMQGPIDKLKEIKTGIDNLDGSSATVTVRFTSTGEVRLPNGVKVDVGQFRENIYRARGGPVRAGQPYIVGEKRPELFVPNESGRIVPRVPDTLTPALASGGIDYYRLAEAVRDSMGKATFAVEPERVAAAVNSRNAQRARY
jgi:hypothetical protein